MPPERQSLRKLSNALDLDSSAERKDSNADTGARVRVLWEELPIVSV